MIRVFQMSRTRLVFIFGLSIILGAQILATPVNPTTEDEVRQYVQESSDRAYTYLNQIRDVTFPSDEDFFNDKENMQIFKDAVELDLQIAQTVKSFKNISITDPLLKRELELLSDADLFILGENYIILLIYLGILESIATDKDICSYTKRDQCDLAYVPDVKKVFAQSHDTHELEYYWKAWRDKNSEWAGDKFVQFVEGYKDAAKLNEKTPVEEWFSTYNDANFLDEMEDVMRQLMPFYTEFHAHVRNVLHRKYGDLVVSENGPIPHHLLEQILIQAWKKNSLLEQPFPERKLPNMLEQLEQHGLDGKRIAEVADSFYDSLGFPKFSSKFWTYHTRRKTREEAGVECAADVFDSTPDVSLKYCKKATFKRFLQLHRDFGRLHYAAQKSHLRYALFASYDFEYAVGEAAILSASTPKHMKRIGLLEDYNYDDQLSMNRLFRMGIHTMFQIPQYFVHTKLMAEVLSNNVTLEHINKRYWELMEIYAGIQPPMNRSSTHLDFPYKFYLDIDENHQTRKFVNEVLGYQFYRALCKISGEFAEGNPGKPLQNCDYYGSHVAGEALKQMMAMGSTRPWKEVLGAVIEDEPDLSGAALLEFYEPLRNWLQGQNRLHNVKLGWTQATKRVID